MQTGAEPSAQTELDLPADCKPCCVAFSEDGRVLLVGGSSRKVHMYTKDGVYVQDVATKASWIWCCAPRPGHAQDVLQVACGCEDGTVSLETVHMSPVHTLHEVCAPLYTCAGLHTPEPLRTIHVKWRCAAALEP